jgi:hypothetical protein
MHSTLKQTEKGFENTLKYIRDKKKRKIKK